MNNKVKFVFAIAAFIILILIGFFIAEEKKEEVLFVNDEQIDSTKICVYIVGEVNSPGIFEVEYGTRVHELIELADGITDVADITRINLAKVLADEEKVTIPKKVIIDEEEKEGSNGCININTATSEKLSTLNGIGKSTAEKIVKFREENGYFNSIEEIMNVSGIGESKFNAIKDNIEV